MMNFMIRGYEWDGMGWAIRYPLNFSPSAGCYCTGCSSYKDKLLVRTRTFSNTFYLLKFKKKYGTTRQQYTNAYHKFTYK